MLSPHGVIATLGKAMGVPLVFLAPQGGTHPVRGLLAPAPRERCTPPLLAPAPRERLDTLHVSDEMNGLFGPGIVFDPSTEYPSNRWQKP